MKPNSNPPIPRENLQNVALHDEIARQAYALWERYGRPAGRDVAIWLEAERQFLGTDPDMRKAGGGAVSNAAYLESAPRPESA
ncbi:MAG TPA: DUF2934 domain-containing protein [Opitutus sp.]|nr:DUF2934 domain-containing protein [Opitutus sp.]